MSTYISKPMPWLAVLLCLTLTHWAKAADAADASKDAYPPTVKAPPKLAEQDIWRRWKLAHDGSGPRAETRFDQGAPTQANKASGFIGMEVRNPKGESLGHIKDLVFDWKTEQVSYAVVSMAPQNPSGTNERLLAVPLAALAVSSDQRHLILNSDKAKIAAAKGFEPDNWPSVSKPSWGAEPLWHQ
jgi:sporulation protein YlmC with PRC-barrel domain